MSRRHFIATTGTIAGTALLNPISELKADTKNSTALPGKKFASHLLVQVFVEHPCGEVI